MKSFIKKRCQDVIFGIIFGLVIGIFSAFLIATIFKIHLEEDRDIRPAISSSDLLLLKQEQADKEAKDISFAYSKMSDTERLRGDAEAYK